MTGSGNKKYAISYDFKDNSVIYQHKFEGLRNTILEQYENSKSPRQRDKAKAFMSKVAQHVRWSTKPSSILQN